MFKKLSQAFNKEKKPELTLEFEMKAMTPLVSTIISSRKEKDWQLHSILKNKEEEKPELSLRFDIQPFVTLPPMITSMREENLQQYLSVDLEKYAASFPHNPIPFQDTGNSSFDKLINSSKNILSNLSRNNNPQQEEILAENILHPFKKYEQKLHKAYALGNLEERKKAIANARKEVIAFLHSNSFEKETMAQFYEEFFPDLVAYPSEELSALFGPTLVQIHDLGTSHSLSPYILQAAIKKGMKVNQEVFARGKESIASAQAKAENITFSKNIGSLLQDYQFERILGRTIIYKHKNSEKRMAIKCQKKEESLMELNMEPEILSHLGKEQKGAQTSHGLYWVDPHELMLSEGISQTEREGFYALVKDMDSTAAFVYEVDDEAYFRYLHDTQLSIPQVYSSARANLTDLIHRLNYDGLGFVTTDLYHNTIDNDLRKDGGYYLTLVDLIKNSCLGNGVLHAWKRGVEFPNFREAGYADKANVYSLHQLLEKESELVSQKYQEAYNNYPPDQAWKMIYANIIAEYLYALHLTLAYRAHKLSNEIVNQEEKSLIWQDTACTMIDLCAYTVSLMTGLPEDTTRRFLMHSIGGDAKRYARQMQYWMTDEYIASTAKNTIPPDIYGKETNAEIDAERLKKDTFNEKIGFSINQKDQDLGSNNSSEPVTDIFTLLQTSMMLIATYKPETMSPVSKPICRLYSSKATVLPANPSTKSAARVISENEVKAVLSLQRQFREKQEKAYQSAKMKIR